MQPNSDVVRHGTIVLAGTLLTNVLGYAFHYAMSRLLGVTGYGSMLGFFSVISLLGIPALVAQTVVAKTIAGYPAAHRPDYTRRYARFLLPRAAWTAIGVAAIVIACQSVLLRFLNGGDATEVLILAWSILFYLVLPIFYGILQGEQRFGGLAITMMTDALLRFALAIVFYAHGYGVSGALYAVAIGATCATALASSLVFDLLHAPKRQLEPIGGGVAGLRSSFRVSAGILVISTLSSVDVLLVKHYRTAYEAGLFGSLALIGRIVYLVASFVPTIVLPKAAANVSAGRSPRPLLIQAAIVFGVMVSAVLLPLLAFPGLLLRTVAGSAYASAAPLLAPYGTAIALLAAAYAAANYNIGINRFAFVVPVIAIGTGEVVAIAFAHDSLLTFVKILAIGHSLIFFATIFRIWAYVDSPKGDISPEPLAS